MTSEEPDPHKITEAEWEERFEPINDTLLSDRPHYVDEHHVWTQLQSDGPWTVYAGFCFVDRMGYWICRNPWADPAAYFEQDYYEEYIDDEDASEDGPNDED